MLGRINFLDNTRALTRRRKANYMRLKIIAVALFLAGCAGTKFGMNQMAQGKTIDISAVAGQANTYQIEVLNAMDFDWNGGNPEDRKKVVDFFLGKQCASTEIISDTPVPSGTYPFTTKARIKHTMLVKCTPK